MDQTQQEIMHSLFSLDPSMENRGHIYPYGYPYGQYTYPYPYPYSVAHTSSHTAAHTSHTAAHTSSHTGAHTNIHPSSHNISLSSHPSQSQNLSGSQANLAPYSVHNVRPDNRFHLGDGGKPDTQHAPEDLRSVQSATRHPDMRPVAQRYMQELRNASNLTRITSSDSRHMLDYSPQPTDLRTHSVDARIYNNARQPSVMRDESRALTEGNVDLRDRMAKSHTDYKYQGSSNIFSAQLSGDPRPPVNGRQYDETRALYGSMNMCTDNMASSTHSQVKHSLTNEYYGNRLNIDSANSNGFSSPTVQDLSLESDPKIQMGAEVGQNTLQNLSQQGLHDRGTAGHTNAPHSLITDALNQHLHDSTKSLVNCHNDVNGEDHTKDFLDNFDDEEDFDSEVTSGDEFSDPYLDLKEMAHGIFNNVNNVAAADDGKPFRCEECSATFSTKGNLKVHQRIHTGEKPYSCDECGKSFSYCATYQAHKAVHTGDCPYKCEYCDRTFFRSEHLERHRRRHTGEKPYKCTECQAAFISSDGLARHTRTHTGEKPFSCKECDMTFAYKSTYLRHRILHDDGSYKCEECGVAYHEPNKLEIHVRKHDDPNYVPHSEDSKPSPVVRVENGVEMFGCEYCQNKYVNEVEYQKHRKCHTGERQFICDMCGSSFVKKAYLEIHMRTHTGERPFKCDSCKSAFKTLTALKFHRRIHTGERPFKCEHCNFAFAQKAALKAHLRIHSGDKPFKCSECDAAFRHNSSLIIHRRTHTGERPYSCDECGAAFTQRPHLNLHKRSHAGIKPYNCDECHASFTKKDYLIAHKSKHAIGNAIKKEALTEAAGDQVYKCPHCEMVFTHHSSLVVHIRKHTGERPFVCEDCGASFLYSSNLTTHRRKHTGERPYKCNQCESAFILKSYLTMHLRKHSGERPFKCDECDARFTQKTHLSTHKRIHTGECPYKCEECGEAFRDGANFWRHKKKHLIGEEAALVTRKKSKRGRGRGRGRTGRDTREQQATRTLPLRRTTRTRRPVLKFEEVYEHLMSQEGEPLVLKEEPDTRTGEDDNEHPYIPINPMVEIKLEDDDEETVPTTPAMHDEEICYDSAICEDDHIETTNEKIYLEKEDTNPVEVIKDKAKNGIKSYKFKDKEPEPVKDREKEYDFYDEIGEEKKIEHSKNNKMKLKLLRKRKKKRKVKNGNSKNKKSAKVIQENSISKKT